LHDVIDKNQLQHALDEIAAKLRDNRQNTAAYFVTLGFSGAFFGLRYYRYWITSATRPVSPRLKNNHLLTNNFSIDKHN
jgi:hypothetical protein